MHTWRERRILVISATIGEKEKLLIPPLRAGRGNAYMYKDTRSSSRERQTKKIDNLRQL